LAYKTLFDRSPSLFDLPQNYVSRTGRGLGSEIAVLTATGIEVYMLSGDEVLRVRSMATALGLPQARAVGGARPDDSARWITVHDRRDT
jgi:soluble P-type ATPase